MFKKVLTLLLVLVGIVTLAACGGGTDDPDPDPTDELTTLEKIAEAMDQLDLPGTASSNLTFITTGLHDVVITWQSDNTDVIANDGTVTIPLYTDGDQTVEVTASLTLDGETLTKKFDIEVIAATEMSDQEKADLAAVAFNGLYSGNQMADLTLPLVGQHDTTVAWSSDNTDVVANDGTVTRPSFETGNVVVHLTGTVTSGTATATVTITVTIVAEGEVNTYASIAALYASAILDEEIEFTGIVTSTFNGGYFITDGTDVLGIYNGNNDFVVVKGDEVKVKGAYANYNSLYQLGSISSQEVLSSGNAITITPIETTVAGLLALDSSDATIHGKYYTVTGTVGLFGDYNNVVLIDGEDQVMVYYQSDPTSLAALEAEVGKEVTVTVVYYTDHSRDGVIVAYDNGAEGIVVTVLTDEEALAKDVEALDTLIPAASVGEVMLPAVGPNGSVYTGWTSHNPALVSNTGVLVGTITENTSVMFSVTVVKGNEMETISVEVMLTPENTPVADLLAMDLGSYGNITGIVYELSYYGFFVVDNGAYIFVYGGDYDVVVGDEVTILGNTGVYSGLVQLYAMDEVVIDSQDNADPVVTMDGTVEGLEMDLYPRGARVTVTGTISIEGSYNNVYLTGAAGGKVVVYYRSNAGELEGFVGQTVTLTVVTYQNETVLFQGVAADVTTAATFDDAANAQAVIDMIDLGDLSQVNTTIDLPGDSTDPVATVEWATSDGDVVTAEGVVTLVSGDTPSATLTVTVTVGAVVLTRDFVVTLMDQDDNTPVPVADALLLADGETVLVIGVITGGYYGERVIQDSTGAALWVDENIYGDMGDEIIVYGTLDTYESNGNNNRILVDASKLSTESTGNDLVVDPETDVAAIFAAKDMMHRYTATLTVTSLNDGFGYVLFNTTPVDYEGTLKDELGFKFYMNEFAPWFDQVYEVGDTVEVTFTILRYSYENIQMVNVEVAVTDAELLAAAVAEVDVPNPVTADLTPPTDIYGVAIAWSSDNTDVIANDGTVTRPAVGAGDATVTLTAVFTIGAETQTETYTVTVSEEAPPITYDHTEDLTNFDGLTNTYTDNGSYVGADGFTWTYSELRRFTDDASYTIGGTGTSGMFGSSGTRELYSTITGGIGSFSIDLLTGYTTAPASDRTIEVYVNDVLVGTYSLTAMATVETFTISDINVAGEFTLKLVATGSRQLVVDNISWTEFS
jgi:hypothetical protein